MKKILPWLAAEQPEIYNAYRSIHSQRVEKLLLTSKAKYIASFIGHEPNKAVFIGLYSINGTTSSTASRSTNSSGTTTFCDSRGNERRLRIEMKTLVKPFAIAALATRC